MKTPLIDLFNHLLICSSLPLDEEFHKRVADIQTIADTALKEKAISQLLDDYPFVETRVRLNLSYRNLESLPEEIFGKMPRLKELNVEGNRLGALPNLPNGVVVIGFAGERQ